jgi:phosphotransferase system HPr (HPr) family protein
VTERRVRILNKLGLHARPAALLVQTAARFKSKVWIRKGDLEVNGKSIMGVMMLAAEQGSDLFFRAEGPDEKEILSALAQLVTNKFHEE